MKLILLIAMSALFVDKQAEQIDQKLEAIFPEVAQVLPMNLPTVEPRMCTDRDVLMVLAGMKELERNVVELENIVNRILSVTSSRAAMKTYVVTALGIAELTHKNCNETLVALNNVDCEKPSAKNAVSMMTVACGRLVATKNKLMLLKSLMGE